MLKKFIGKRVNHKTSLKGYDKSSNYFIIEKSFANSAQFWGNGKPKAQ